MTRQPIDDDKLPDVVREALELLSDLQNADEDEDESEEDAE